MAPAPEKDEHQWPAEIVSVVAGKDVYDCSTISLRCNGQCFHIQMSARFVRNSPNATALYLKILQAIHPRGSGKFEGISDKDVYVWIIRMVLSTFNQLTPELLPQSDPSLFRNEEVENLVSEDHPRKIIACKVEAVDETFLPQYISTSAGLG
ncbi:hypothetical protein IWW34DRAFT_855744 [Fusarium oxysporum f. sp. albedinis]|nr:hypothetical protein IWW34DRAFT_855744 [Fusarium oxysporum f. sp. albedinis]KAK2469857.1 hypothetical protein H9L39_18672 [Fusarium oxysporum f. sp. albedinis]